MDGYLPADKSGDFAYQAADIGCVVLIVWLLYQMLQVKGQTYQAREDSFRICPAVVVSLGLAAFLHADMD